MGVETKRNRNRTVLFGVVLAALFVAAFPLAINKDMSDFGVCYRAGERIARGEMIYRAADGHLQYKYAPVGADVYALFGFLPWPAAKAAWYLLTLVLLAATAITSYRLIPQPKWGPIPLLGLAFLIMLKYLARELQLGQVNILMIFLLTAMSALFLERKDFAAGASWGIALFFKPYALVFLPYFLLKKRFRVLAGGGAAVLAGLALPIMNYGFRGNILVLKAWASSLTRSTPRLLSVGDNASIIGFIIKLAGGGAFSAASMAVLTACALLIGLALLAMMFWLKDKRGESAGTVRTRELSELAYLLVLIPLFSPLGWNYNYLYGFLAVMLILNGLGKLALGWRVLAIANFVLIGATLYELMGPKPFHFYTRHSLVALDFLVVLALLLVLRRAALRPSPSTARSSGAP